MKTTTLFKKSASLLFVFFVIVSGGVIFDHKARAEDFSGGDPSTKPGALLVTIVPPELLRSGAKWSYDKGVTWHDSGSTVAVEPGVYSIMFAPIVGWETPVDQNITVTGGQISSVVVNSASRNGESGGLTMVTTATPSPEIATISENADVSTPAGSLASGTLTFAVTASATTISKGGTLTFTETISNASTEVSNVVVYNRFIKPDGSMTALVQYATTKVDGGATVTIVRKIKTGTGIAAGKWTAVASVGDGSGKYSKKTFTFTIK